MIDYHEYEYGGSVMCKHQPTLVFEYEGRRFYGASKYELETSNHENEMDLVLNLTYYSTTSRTVCLLDGPPEWTALNELLPTRTTFEEIIWNWPDYEVWSGNLTFWKGVIQVILNDPKYQRICVTCTGGHGRTGTALAIFAMLLLDLKGSEALILVRDRYCTKACETYGQENYIRAFSNEPALVMPLNKAISDKFAVLTNVKSQSQFMWDLGASNGKRISDKGHDDLLEFCRNFVNVHILSYDSKMIEEPYLHETYDCNQLPNPAKSKKVRELTGEDEKVQDFVGTRIAELLLIDAEEDAFRVADTGYDRIRIGFKCVGGRQRSVAMAELFHNQIKGHFRTITVLHCQLYPHAAVVDEANYGKESQR